MPIEHGTSITYTVSQTRRPVSTDRTACCQFQAVMKKYTNMLSGYQFPATASLRLLGLPSIFDDRKTVHNETL